MKKLISWPIVTTGTITTGSGLGSGGNITLKAGSDSSSGSISIRTEKNTVTKKFKLWKRVICWLLGHKEVKEENIKEQANANPEFNLCLIKNEKLYKREFKICSRCGIFHDDTVSYEVPLTEDEKMVKDIIT